MVEVKLAWLEKMMKNKADAMARIPAHLLPNYSPPKMVEIRQDELANLRAENERLREALRPFANVAARIREAAPDNRWLEQVLFYMGDDNDPTKWSLTGRAFDIARAALEQNR
jgi:hypothetical protein